MSWWSSSVNGTTIGDGPADKMSNTIIEICEMYEKQNAEKLPFQHFINLFAYSLKTVSPDIFEPYEGEFNYLTFEGEKKPNLRSDPNFNNPNEAIIKKLHACFGEINHAYEFELKRKPTFMEMLEVLKFSLPVFLDRFSGLPKKQDFNDIIIL